VLKATLGEGRFVGVAGARDVVLGGPDRVPWMDVPETRLDERNEV